MSKRFDVMSPRRRKDQEKTYWHKVGSAFEGEKGINIVFDSLPLPDAEGRVSVALFEPRPKDGDEKPAKQVNRAGKRDDMGGDEIPF